MNILAALMGAFLTFFFIVFLMLAFRNKRSADMMEVLSRHIKTPIARKEEDVDEVNVRLLKMLKKLSRPLVEKNSGQSMEDRLQQAGIPLLGGEFITLNLLAMALTGFLTWFITLDGVLAGGAVVLVPVGIWTFVLVLKARRLSSFTEQLGDCLMTISNALRAGYSFQQTIEVISREMEPPIGSEFAAMNHEIIMGVPLEEALENANKRIGSPDFELVVTAVLIQREVGGNLAQVLDNISYTIVERIRMRREITALTSQGRMSAFVLLGLPFVAGFAMFSINPKNFMVIFEEPMGQIAVAAGIISEIIGYFVIMKIVDVEV